MVMELEMVSKISSGCHFCRHGRPTSLWHYTAQQGCTVLHGNILMGRPTTYGTVEQSARSSMVSESLSGHSSNSYSTRLSSPTLNIVRNCPLCNTTLILLFQSSPTASLRTTNSRQRRLRQLEH